MDCIAETPGGPASASHHDAAARAPASDRRAVFFIGLALALVTGALYWPAVQFDFVNYDDGAYVTDNPRVVAGLSFEGAWWAFGHAHASNWHPLTWLSHMLDCSVFGLFAGGHHLTNLLLHALNSVLLFLLWRRLTGALWRCAFVAALFAWHPLHVESVAWVSERKDVLSTLFLILTVWAYARYVAQPRPRRYAGVLGCFALALMSKPMTVTLPCLLLLLDYWPLRRLSFAPREAGGADADTPDPFRTSLLGAIVEKAPLFAMSALACALTVWAQDESGSIMSFEIVPLSQRLPNAVVAYSAYLWKMIWPSDLAVFYPLPARWSWGWVIGSAALLAAISALALRARQRSPWLAVGWLWYLGTLVPVIGLVQVGVQAMADRYTYVPLIGLFIAVAWGAGEGRARWRLSPATVAIVAGIVVLSCLPATTLQLRYWRTSVALFERTLAVTRHNLTAHNNLGIALAAAGRGEEAIAQYCEILRLNTNDVRAHYNLSLELINQGRLTQAVAQLREVIRLQPDSAPAHNNLGVLLGQQDRFPEAIRHLITAVKLRPDYPKGHLNLARALAHEGQVPAALRHYRVATELDPQSPEAFEELARILATHEEARFRDGPAAVRLAERACALTERTDPSCLNTLAAAYAETGRFAEAVDAGEKARELAIAGKQGKLAALIEERLKLYRAGQPFRERKEPPRRPPPAGTTG
jgi:Flp pilus assembly protein TadD